MKATHSLREHAMTTATATHAAKPIAKLALKKGDPKAVQQIAAVAPETKAMQEKVAAVAAPEAKVAAPVQGKAQGKGKVAEDKPKKNANTSTIESPVAAVHALCEKMKGAARKDIIAAAVAKGINKYTASTQIQRWRSMQPAPKK
jgi:hypothetical protein